MSKYTHMTDDELIAHVDKFGTDDEKEIISKLHPDYFDSSCEQCSEYRAEIIHAGDVARKVRDGIDDLIMGLPDE